MLKECLDNQANSPKRAYCAPQLVRYGALRELTQGGTGQASENKADCLIVTQKPSIQCPSDRITKENIVRIGTHPLGIGLYLFDYKPGFRDQWGHGRQFGVIAQEVEAVMPKAVIQHPDGYKMVDYEVLGICRQVH